MNLRQFFETLPLLYDGFGTPQVMSRPDADWDRIIRDIPCFTNRNVIALLSWAVSHLSVDEIYVECGCWNGVALIGALLHNYVARGVGVDNFSQFGGSLESTKGNVQRYGLSSRVRIVPVDCLDFWQQHDDRYPQKVGVYFYDADHHYQATVDGLRASTPYLADDALIVIDDYNWPEVKQAVADFVLNEPPAALVMELLTPGEVNMHPTWWNGLALIEWRRKGKVNDATVS